MVILGLGSNLGNRLNHLSQAIRLLSLGDDALIHNITLSPIYESKAHTLPNAPESWRDAHYLNMAVMAETHLTPHKLLKKVKEIEQSIGRIDGGRWAPREIDIDILLYDDVVICDDELEIPHKMLTQRNFVLKPIADLIPNETYHKKGTEYHKTYRQLYESLENNDPLLKMEYEISF